ncbi:ROK family protein [Glaciihabitans arcticus]|uniref:ROK family protein n=1 Tax=Glaciihabitans arcticus TaxID=2668039 RepID=A0A4Q9GY73_9MICO|nr:ROK family protein [Glaciihabitans arcticus]TBN57733.1 ROK family protein [Glaciihabitans arcticus]
MRVGIDIGGTKTEAVLLADDGSIAQKLRLPTGWGPAAVLESTVEAVTGLVSAAGIRFEHLSTVGVGIPGAVDSRAGRVTHALNLGVEHLDLGAELSHRFATPVRVENDVNAAALGAFHLLDLPADSSMGYLNLGTGLAAGLVLGGSLWRGSRGAAGEIGHILVDPLGPLDLDGQPGGLEVMASGSGIARQWATGEDNAVSAVLDAADAGDARALEIRRRLFEGVATSVRILVLTVDVELVVIGGGISHLGDRVLGGVTAILDTWAASSPFIDSLGLPERLRRLPEGSPVAALGAAYLGAPRG